MEQLYNCKACNESKPIGQFYRDKYKYNGLKYEYCKTCAKQFKQTKHAQLGDRIDKDKLMTLYADTPHDISIGKTTCHSSLFIGSSKSGKSTLIKDMILTLKHKYDLIIVFSESLHDGIYSYIDYGDKSNFICFDSFDESIIEDLFTLNKQTNNTFNFLVLFDDMTGLKTRDSNAITQLFIRGRNSGISIFFSTQHYALINKAVRTNCNYVYLLRTNSPSVRSTLAEQFLYNVLKTPPSLTSKTKKLDWYNNYLVDNTSNYGIIIINNLSDPPEVYKYMVV